MNLKFFNAAVVVAIVVTFVATLMYYSNRVSGLENKLQIKEAEKINAEAAADSFKAVSDGLYERLSFVTKSDSMKSIERETIGKELKGAVVQITTLRAKLRTLESNKSSESSPSAVDSTGNKTRTTYKFFNRFKTATIRSTVEVFSSDVPDSTSLSSSVEFEPVSIVLATEKLSDREYRVYAKVDPDALIVVGGENHVSFEETSKPKEPNLGAGVGFGMDPEGKANVSGGIRFGKQMFSLTFGGKNRFGFQYLRILR